MLAIMAEGGAGRVVASTRMNADSSRSHAVFVVRAEQRDVAAGTRKVGGV